MVKYSMLLIVVLLLCGCGLLGIFPRERLHIKRTDQSLSIDRLQLKVDGYYSYQTGSTIPFSKRLIYLFRNGVCFVSGYGASTEESKNIAEDMYFKQKILQQDAPLGWGTYEIKKDSLYIDYWTMIRNGMCYNRFALKGRIMSDTTILMENMRGLDSAELFHFVPLKNKPDSTNRFIK